MTMSNYHSEQDNIVVKQSMPIAAQKKWKFTYTFENFFHPFAGELIAQLNKESLSGLLDATFHEELRNNKNKNPGIDNISADDFFFENFGYEKPQESSLVQVNGFPKEIDVSTGGPYANYNWELLFHVPLMIAVHLSKNQRFAEAQRWFHYIFDPTSNDESVEPKKRFWKFLAFRNLDVNKRIEDIVAILSIPRSELSPAEQDLQDEIWGDYTTILNKPFRPHGSRGRGP